MASLLDNPAIRDRTLPVSVEFYHKLGNLGLLEDSRELLSGIITRKISKSPLHFLTLTLLARHLRNHLPPDVHLRTEGPLTLSDSEPEPDLAIVTGDLTDYAMAHPGTAILVVEIAVTSLEYDRAKTSIYAAAGIAEYWILRPSDRVLEIHTQPGPEGYGQTRTLTPDDPPPGLPFREVPLTWAHLLPQI